MALSLFNCFTIPLGVSFEPEFMESITYTIINDIIDFVFVIDLIINCRTIYINPKTGEEIKTPKKICIEYVKSFRFWIDFLATIPLDDMFSVLLVFIIFQDVKSKNTKVLQIVGILKLGRILRLNRVITSLNVKDTIKAVRQF